MGLHTHTTKGKQVIIILIDGTVIEDRFVSQPKSHRWIVLEKHGRIPRAQIKAMANKKGSLNSKRLGRGKSNGTSPTSPSNGREG